MIEVRVFETPDEVAGAAADLVATQAAEAIARRGRFIVAFSGGRTPGAMLRAVADADIDWSATWVCQVDERLLPDGDPGRNLTGLRADLLDRIDLPDDHLLALPVDGTEAGLDAFIDRWRTLTEGAGVADLVHLGVGPDGHTASLFADDPALDVDHRAVTLVGEHAGHRRVTLTLSALARAELRLAVATGADKADVLRRVLWGEWDLPASRVLVDPTVLMVDAAADPGG